MLKKTFSEYLHIGIRIKSVFTHSLRILAYKSEYILWYKLKPQGKGEYLQQSNYIVWIYECYRIKDRLKNETYNKVEIEEERLKLKTSTIIKIWINFSKEISN